MANERALFDAFNAAATGSQREDVIGASLNMVANAIRQSHAELAKAEIEIDERVAQIKAMLRKDHYDALGYRRDNRITLPSPELLTAIAKRPLT